MSPFASRLKPSLGKFLCTVIAVTTLTGCDSLTRRSKAPDPTLVRVACPPLTPLTDDSFGATTIKLIEVAGQYYKCREAALAEVAK